MNIIRNILGDVMIGEIFDECQLSPESRDLVHTILARWEGLDWNISERMRIATELIGENTQKAEIVLAITWIAMEFANRRVG